MLLDRYILSEWFKVFLLSFLSILGLLLIDDVQDELKDLLDNGASASEAFTYYGVLLPSFVPTVLPVALLISLLFSLGSLHQNQEVIAMRSAGCSIWRVTRSLWIASVLLAICLWTLNTRLVPWSVETSTAIWNNHEFEKELESSSAEDVGLVHNLTFYNSQENRLWFINRFSQFNYRAYGITVSLLNEAGTEVERIVANEGYYDDIRNKWTFLKGRTTQFSPENGEVIRSLPFDERFGENYIEDPQLMKVLEKRPKDLSSKELAKIIQVIDSSADSRVNPYAVAYYDRLFNPLSCLIVLGLAIPFALSGVRTNPMIGVSKSMGLFVLYYIALSVSQLLGRGFIPPALAAILPNLAALGVVVFLFWRFRKPA